MCSVYRLNKQGDSRKPCHIPFSIMNQSVVPDRGLTIASWPEHKFLRRQVRWSCLRISLRAFHSLSWSTQSKAFSIVDETEIHVFLKFPCFFYNPVNVGNLISSSSSFSKPSLDIWVCIMLKPSMQDFKHDLTSMGHECNCPMVSTFFGTLLGDWDEYWPFLVLWPLLGLPDLPA